MYYEFAFFVMRDNNWTKKVMKTVREWDNVLNNTDSLYLARIGKDFLDERVQIKNLHKSIHAQSTNDRILFINFAGQIKKKNQTHVYIHAKKIANTHLNLSGLTDKKNGTVKHWGSFFSLSSKDRQRSPLDRHRCTSFDVHHIV